MSKFELIAKRIMVENLVVERGGIKNTTEDLFNHMVGADSSGIEGHVWMVEGLKDVDNYDDIVKKLTKDIRDELENNDYKTQMSLLHKDLSFSDYYFDTASQRCMRKTDNSCRFVEGRYPLNGHNRTILSKFYDDIVIPYSVEDMARDIIDIVGSVITYNSASGDIMLEEYSNDIAAGWEVYNPLTNDVFKSNREFDDYIKLLKEKNNV